MTSTSGKTLKALAAATLLAAGTMLGAAGTASATDPSTREPAEIPWRWWDGGLYALAHNGESIPGMDDDGCKPSPEHPNPVLLLHGTGANGPDNYATLGQALLNEGYCVWAPNYGVPPGMPRFGDTPLAGGMATLPQTGAEIAREIDRIRELTGAEKVDLAGMSQGGMVAGYVAKVERPGAVGRVVSMGAPWPRQGMRSLYEVMEVPPQVGGSIADLPPGVMPDDGLDAWLGPEGTPFAEDVEYTLVASRVDGVAPVNTALALGETVRQTGINRVLVQDGCEVDRSTHMNLYVDPRAVDATLNALDPANAKPLRCVPTDGLVGPALPVPPRG